MSNDDRSESTKAHQTSLPKVPKLQLRVDKLVTAFQEGLAIVQGIKKKRRGLQALMPPRDLEAALNAGPVAVEAKMVEGVKRFGTEFANGDRRFRRHLNGGHLLNET